MKELGGLVHLFACVFLFHFSGYMVIPALTDVTMEALCPGRDECSLAIYLTGFQQAISGLGTLMVTPLVGNLSDKHGRKALLTLPMTVAIIPLAILAYSRSSNFFYAYFAIKTLTTMFCEGSMQSLSLAYVADKVCEQRRISAFGVLSGVSAAGFVSGTLTSRFLSTPSTFKVSTAVAMIAAVYMRAFLEDPDAEADIIDESCHPLCASPCKEGGDSFPRLPSSRKVPSLADTMGLLSGSSAISQAAIVAFFTSLGDSGIQAALLYYLKAQFQFSKDQFANLLLITGVAGTLSQLLLMPILAPSLGEEKLLSLGLLAGCAHIFLYSIAWASWVPYIASTFLVMSVFVQPCIRSIVSKRVGSNEQGMTQGCITGISSFASILAPIVFTPLTALFLSDSAPFEFKGFSVMCAGFASLAAFTLSITMKAAPPISTQKLTLCGHGQV